MLSKQGSSPGSSDPLRKSLTRMIQPWNEQMLSNTVYLILIFKRAKSFLSVYNAFAVCWQYLGTDQTLL